jgi:uncharacterized integral membrane protein
MQFIFWIAFLLVIGLAIFAVQNSTTPPVVMKFLFWQFQTSFIYSILGSVAVGVVITLLFWIPRAIRASLRAKNLRKKVGALEEEMKRHVEETQPEGL